jgi:hypothetical protein
MVTVTSRCGVAVSISRAADPYPMAISTAEAVKQKVSFITCHIRQAK